MSAFVIIQLTPSFYHQFTVKMLRNVSVNHQTAAVGLGLSRIDLEFKLCAEFLGNLFNIPLLQFIFIPYISCLFYRNFIYSKKVFEFYLFFIWNKHQYYYHQSSKRTSFIFDFHLFFSPNISFWPLFILYKITLE